VGIYVVETLNVGKVPYRFTDPDAFLNCDNPTCAAAWLTREGLDTPLPRPGLAISPVDWQNFTTCMDLSPEPAEDFQRACSSAANRTLRENRARYWAIVGALLANGHLNFWEVNELWHTGAFTFRGRIGTILYAPSRADTSAWECPLPAAA